MTAIRDFNRSVEVLERMRQNNISFHNIGLLVVLTGLGSTRDKTKYEFDNFEALSNFLDGYIIGLNYRET